MRLTLLLQNTVWIAAFCLSAQAQTPAAKEANPTESKGLPTRNSAADYQGSVKIGKLSLGAEFARHAVPTPQGEFSTEDYVTVEVGIFGPAGEKLRIANTDFSIKVNGKKPVTSQIYGAIFGSLKDPSWEPPVPPSKSKTSSVSTGGDEEGGGQQDKTPPVPPKMPILERHAMEQKVQKAALPEGERALPVAGLLFFLYRGESKKINSVELTYNGPAGRVTLELNP